MSKPIDDDDANAIVSIVARSMEFTIRALGQSAALAEVLIEKGLTTRSELDAKYALVEPAIKKQIEMLFRFRERFE